MKSVVLLSNLPAIGPDQTLYSWCAHVHAMNTARDALSTSTQLFGAPFAALCHDFPSRLAHLTTSYPEAQFDADELALRHTLLGYFLALQPRATADRLLAEIVSGSVPSIKMRLGITASRVGGHHPLKGCDSCIQEDGIRTGFAHWHTEHQFASVIVCSKHRRPLFIAWDPVTPVHRRGWLLPTCGLKWERITISVRDDKQLGQLCRLAHFSEKLASCAPATFDAYQLASCYQHGLRDRGFITASGSLRLKTLVNEMRSRYRGIEDIAGFEALKSVTPDWPGMVGSVARTSPRSAHPLKHLLMIALVYETWADFLQMYKGANSRQEAPSADMERTQNLPDPSKTLISLVKDNALSITSAARVLGIATTTAAQMARRAGIEFAARPKVMKGIRLARIERLLRRGWSSKRVSESTGASVVSINRLLAANLDLKQAWQTTVFLKRRKLARKTFLAAAKRCHEATIKELRQIRGCDYMWLYRHDREWLRMAIPALWNR